MDYKRSRDICNYLRLLGHQLNPSDHEKIYPSGGKFGDVLVFANGPINLSCGNNISTLCHMPLFMLHTEKLLVIVLSKSYFCKRYTSLVV